MNSRSHESEHTVESLETCEPCVVDQAVVEDVLASLPDDRTTAALAAIFDALSDPTRLRILQALLRAGSLCVCDLATITGVSASGVSHQLRLLRDRDLVTSERDGKRAVYRLADAHVSRLLGEGLDHAHEAVSGVGKRA